MIAGSSVHSGTWRPRRGIVLQTAAAQGQAGRAAASGWPSWGLRSAIPEVAGVLRARLDFRSRSSSEPGRHANEHVFSDEPLYFLKCSMRRRRATRTPHAHSSATIWRHARSCAMRACRQRRRMPAANAVTELLLSKYLRENATVYDPNGIRLELTSSFPSRS